MSNKWNIAVNCISAEFLFSATFLTLSFFVKRFWRITHVIFEQFWYHDCILFSKNIAKKNHQNLLWNKLCSSSSNGNYHWKQSKKNMTWKLRLIWIKIKKIQENFLTTYFMYKLYALNYGTLHQHQLIFFSIWCERFEFLPSMSSNYSNEDAFFIFSRKQPVWLCLLS